MLKISEFSVSGSDYCNFGGKCPEKAQRNGACTETELVFDAHAIANAKANHLRPARDRSIRYYGIDPEVEVGVVRLCPKALANDQVTEGIKVFLRAVAPEALIEDEEELLAHIEADKVATGEIQNPDDITTEAGLEMLDRVTSIGPVPFAWDRKLTFLRGQMQVIPVYETETR